MESQCSVGMMNESKCHLTTYSKTVGTESMLVLEPGTSEIIMWRTGITILYRNATVCYHNKYMFLKWYITQEKKCCNPFG